MNYEEARVYLDETSKYGSVLGLENMKALLDRLDNPQESLKFIHISGTNGKGTVLAYLSTILRKAGYRTGRYISPTLFSYRERIQVNEEKIEKEALAQHVTAIAAAVADMGFRRYKYYSDHTTRGNCANQHGSYRCAGKNIKRNCHSEGRNY